MDDGHQPLLEPALIVSENCPECRGTGVLPGDLVCDTCGGTARLVHEVPMSEAWEMMQSAHARAVAPPPSILREGS